MNASFPALFVSHGSPMLAIQDGPAHRFLAGLGDRLGRPRAIVIATAHWETAAPMVSGAPRPETIHDFGGFPRALYEIQYPAPGEPALAARTAALLSGAGFGASVDPRHGLDHGAWMPLYLAYPAADVPVVALSIQPHLGPEHHFRVGRALRPLRDEGVLIVGSGALTHNLRAFFGPKVATEGDTAQPWVQAFADWIAEAVAEGRTGDLLAYRGAAPYARENHPTDEHLLPLFVALGAGTPEVGGEILHRSHDHGIIAMDSYAFA